MAKNKNTSEFNYLQLFKTATAFVVDVDGVMTDGSLLVMNNGDELRIMNIRDGYALKQAVEKGFTVGVISGGKSKGMVRRLNKLKIKHVLMGVEDKKPALIKWAQKIKLDLSKTIYIGDDVLDLGAMQSCGIPCCPKDAITEVAAISKYVSPFAGGRGCVRDIIEKVMKLQKKWSV